MRQSCRIVNDQVFGHVCGGDHGHADRAHESRATPRGPPRTAAPLRWGGTPRRSLRPGRHAARVPPAPSVRHVPCEPVSEYRTPRAPREPFTPGGRGKSPGRRGGSEGREEWADLGIRAGTGSGFTRSGPGLEVRSLPYDDPRAPLKRRAPPPPAPDDRGRRAEVSRCIRSRRRQPTPQRHRAAEPRGSGTPGPLGMGRSADPALPTSP